MAGWIKIHRDLAKHWLSQDMEKLGRWIDLLMLASYEENRVLIGDRLTTVERGQMVVSYDFLSHRWNCSKSTVSKFLDLLESDGMVERKCERKATILTICNYDSYQQTGERTANATANDCRTIAERLPNELKKGEEVKEIINIQAAHAREESPSWIASVEQGYLATFKGLGAAMPMARKTGIPADEIMKLLDCYMADRELKGRGHKDYNEFRNLFLWHVENGKITLPRQPERKPKVIAGADILKIYG